MLSRLAYARTQVPGVTVVTSPAATQTVTLTNNTGAALTVSIDTSHLDGTFFHLGQPGPLTIQPGQSVTLSVSFGATGKCQHKGKIVFTGDGLPAGGEALPVQAAAD